MNQNGSQLIFLISQPRAGSTLLQYMLGGHPQIHTAPEPWIMLHPAYALRSTGHSAEYESGLAHQALVDFYRELPRGEETVIESIRAAGLHLYGSALAQAGKQLFLDKTPRYYLILPELLRIFPEARFVFLLRNPLAVLSSILTTWVKGYWPTLANYKSDLLRAPGLMLEGIERCGSRAITIRYEELVADPPLHISALCRALDIEFYETMLSYDRSVMRPGKMGDPVGVHKYARPVRDCAAKWLSQLAPGPENELAGAYLEALGSDTLTRLGYVPDRLTSDLADCRDAGRPQDEPATREALTRLGIDRPLRRLKQHPLPSPTSARAIRLFTSLAPGNTPLQQAAVAGWLQLGFEAFSVNAADEIAALQADYPDVQFIEAARDARTQYAKPLIYFDDIRRIGLEGGGSLWGIINSDIRLRAESDLPAWLHAYAGEGLLFGSRCDISDPDATAGKCYERGFDFFFFTPDAARRIPPSDFCLGMPWWDFWVPLAALLQGCSVKLAAPSFACHVEHTLNWNPRHWLTGGQMLAERIAAMLSEAGPSPAHYRSAFTHAFSTFMLSACNAGPASAAIEHAVAAERAFTPEDRPAAAFSYRLAQFLQHFLQSKAVSVTYAAAPHAASDISHIKQLLAANRYAEAIESLEAANAHGDSHERMTLHGEALFGLQRIDDAKRLFAAAAERWPQAVTALNNLAVIHMLEKNYSEARTLLQKAISIDAGNESALSNLRALERSTDTGEGPAAAMNIDIRQVS